MEYSCKAYTLHVIVLGFACGIVLRGHVLGFACEIFPVGITSLRFIMHLSILLTDSREQFARREVQETAGAVAALEDDLALVFVADAADQRGILAQVVGF